jgi:small multidrug resistance pump
MNWLMILFYVMMSVGGQVLFKLGAQRDFGIVVSLNSVKMEFSWISLIGGVCYVCSFLLYLFLISRYDLNRIIPVLIGLTYTLTLGASIFVFRETFTFVHCIGIVLIFVGVLLVVNAGAWS